MIETTVNIRDDLLEKLNISSGKMNISRSGLISVLLLRYMDSHRAGDRVFQRLKYQSRDTGCPLSPASLCLREDFYERWCDVRKAFKLSASLVVALAVELYLDKIINEYYLEDQPFNNGNMYVIESYYDGSVNSYYISWGLPEKKILERHTTAKNFD